MIEPALTAEDWARGWWEDSTGDFMAEPTSDGLIVHMSSREGACDAFLREPERLALAALCLHGRVTWEMVDALRSCIATAEENNAKPGVFDRANAVADLIESLLAPRTTP